MTLSVDQLNEDDRLAFDLIQSMLNSDPDERPTAAQVLKHEYFRIRIQSDPKVGKNKRNQKV